jgi:hypothetical protein
MVLDGTGKLTLTDLAVTRNVVAPLRISVLPTDTTSQLIVTPGSGTLAVEGKIRLYGTFPTGADTGARLAASLRSGFSVTGWGSEYLSVWLSSTTNDVASDANMQQIANFTLNNATFGSAAVAAAQSVVVDGQAGQYRGFVIRTSGISRWSMQATNGAEGGSNTGSNFQIACANDAGSPLFTPLQINRTTGVITINNGLTMPLLTNAANDAAAASAGIGVGQFYRNGSIVMQRAA